MAAVLLLILVAPTQYSYALQPRWPFILYADLWRRCWGFWLISVLIPGAE